VVDASTQSVAGSSHSSSQSQSLFSMTLGAPQQIAGVTLYAVSATRYTAAKGVQPDATTVRWKYLGSTSDGIVGSIDGKSVVTLYGSDGAVVEGLFGSFDTGRAPQLQNTAIANVYGQLDTLAISASASEGGCRVIGDTTVCDDFSSSTSQTEYFANGVGAAGFDLKSDYSSSGGGFQTVSSSKSHMQLVRSSLKPADGTALPDFRSTPASATLPAPLNSAAVAVQSGKVYAFGGGVAGATPLGVTAFKPDDSRWFTAGPAPLEDHRLRGAKQPDLVPLDFTGWEAQPFGSDTIMLLKQNAGQMYRFRPSDGSWYYDAAGYYSGLHDGHTPFGVEGSSASWTDANGVAHLVLVTAASPTGSGAQWNLDVQEYAGATGTWSARANATAGSNSIRSAVIGEHLYLVPADQTLIDCTLSANMCVSRGKVFAVARSKPQVVVAAGKLYLMGGQGADGRLRDVEVFDPTTGLAVLLPPLLSARGGFAAAALSDGIHVFGGDGALGVEIYRP
jgi:hypothetical protein